MSNLPNGWTSAPVADLTSKVGSGATPAGGNRAYKEAGTPLIRSMNVRFSGFDDKGLVFLDEKQAKKLDGVTVRANDVLLNITGASIGRVCIAPQRMDGARVNQHVSILRLLDGIETRFASAFFGSPQMQRIILEENYGVTRQALTKSMIEAFQVPVPPLPEQRRIVAKIDSLSAKSKRARDHLDHIPRLVEKHKQAILAAAFRGDLTREWRGPSEADGHQRTALRNLCISITDGDHQAPPRAQTGIPFITIAAMNNGEIDIQRASRFVPSSYFEALKSTRRPAEGDILYSVTGSIGIPALVNFGAPFVFQRHIAILKPDRSKVDARYLYRMLGAPQVMDQALAVATGTAQLTIPLGGLRDFSIPYPSIEEQSEIARLIDKAFAWINRLAADATSARKLIDNLDQAILAKAFRGELVPQDPNDEPASELLERIKASNGTTPAGKRSEPPRGRRVRDAGMGGLVQQQAASGADRKHPAR